MEISKIPTTVRNVQGWYEKSVVRTVRKIQGWYEKYMVRNVYGTNSLWYEKSGNHLNVCLDDGADDLSVACRCM